MTSSVAMFGNDSGMLLKVLLVVMVFVNTSATNAMQHKPTSRILTNKPQPQKPAQQAINGNMPPPESALDEELKAQFGGPWVPTDIDLQSLIAGGENATLTMMNMTKMTNKRYRRTYKWRGASRSLNFDDLDDVILDDSNNRGSPKGGSHRPHSSKNSDAIARAYKKMLRKYLEGSLLQVHKHLTEKPISKSKSLKHIFTGSAKKMLCAMKKINPLALSSSYSAFKGNSLAEAALPRKPLMPTPSGQFDSCAVVSNSGRMLGSKFAHEIDSHDQVIRMNAAPVTGFEADVGTKTTVRLINDILAYCLNSECPHHPENFADTKKALMLAWDVCRPRAPFHSCLLNSKTDNIKNARGSNSIGGFLHWKAKNKKRKAYFLDPNWLYNLTDFLQNLTPAKIGDAVPSTGFLAYSYLAHHCKKIHMYHMIPAIGQKHVCSYHKPKERSDYSYGCSVNYKHQRQVELAVFMKLNEASDTDTYRRGKSVLPGFVGLKC